MNEQNSTISISDYNNIGATGTGFKMVCLGICISRLWSSNKESPSSWTSVRMLYNHIVREVTPQHLPNTAMQIVSKDAIMLIQSTFNRNYALLVSNSSEFFDNPHYSSSHKTSSALCNYVTDLCNDFSHHWCSVGYLG